MTPGLFEEWREHGRFDTMRVVHATFRRDWWLLAILLCCDAALARV